MYTGFALQMGIYAWCITLVCLLWDRPFLLLLGTGVTSFLMLLRWHTRDDLRFYFLAMLLGPLAEAPAVYFRAWSYSGPLYLIPIWLPLLWGIVGLVLKKSVDALRAGPTRREPVSG